MAVALTWEQGGALTIALAAAALATTLATRPRLRAIAPFAREATIIAGLYSLWQLAGTLSVLGTDGAFSRARWIERTEHAWHLPSEAGVQRTLASNATVAQAANIYYAAMHFGALFAFLIWLFVRHQDRYRQVRRVLALTTLVCLAIQLVPVAPPRLLVGSGYVDTALAYGQSVYGLGFGADQLSAMPSVHVAWAVLVGWVVWRLGGGPGRFVGPLHAVVTVLVVVVTANHFWADGIVAIAVLVACVALERGAVAALVRVRPDHVSGSPGLSSAANGGILRS